MAPGPARRSLSGTWSAPDPRARAASGSRGTAFAVTYTGSLRNRAGRLACGAEIRPHPHRRSARSATEGSTQSRQTCAAPHHHAAHAAIAPLAPRRSTRCSRAHEGPLTRRISAAQELPSLKVTVSLLTNYEQAADCYDWKACGAANKLQNARSPPSPVLTQAAAPAVQIGVHGIIIDFIDPQARFVTLRRGAAQRCYLLTPARFVPRAQGVARSATYLPEIAEREGWTLQETILSLVRKSGFTVRGSSARPPPDTAAPATLSGCAFYRCPSPGLGDEGPPPCHQPRAVPELALRHDVRRVHGVGAPSAPMQRPRRPQEACQFRRQRWALC